VKREGVQGVFIPPIPHPLANLFRFHQLGLPQDRHMVRDSRLGEMYAHFDIGSAKANVLANRTAAPFFERLQDFAPVRVGNGVQHPI